MVWLYFAAALALIAIIVHYAKQRRVRQLPTSRERTPKHHDSSRPDERRSGRGTGPHTCFPLQWFGAGTSLQVAGFHLRSPLVYASLDPKADHINAIDPSEIQIQALVRGPSARSTDLGYWPAYSKILPEQRHAYLEWLASGRLTLPDCAGYLFLYYYGLERRLLVDGQDTELILREIIRLRQLDERRAGTRAGGSFRRYSTSLLWYEVAKAPERFRATDLVMISGLTETWNLELANVVLAAMAVQEAAVPAEVARRLSRLSPRAQNSVVARRSPNEFCELFNRRYAERMGDTAKPRLAGTQRRFWYRCASAAIPQQNCLVHQVAGMDGVLRDLADVWNSCVRDLRTFSRVSLNAGGVTTVAAWEAMPPELRADTDHPLGAQVQELVAQGSGEGGECLMPAGRFATLLEIPERPKLTSSQSRRVAEALEQTGYDVEPDTRISGTPYGWTETTAVFLRTDTTPVDADRYAAAACVLRLGLAVAQADGRVHDDELRRLVDHVDAAFDLSATERRRLEALRSVLLQSGSDLSAIAKRVERGVPLKARGAVGRLLVAIAAADGRVDDRESGALRRCYRALGLSMIDLDRTLAEVSPPDADDLVTVQIAAPPTAGEAIPAPAPPPAVALNRAAILAIMLETREVATLLASAMAVEEAEPAPGNLSADAERETAPSPPPGDERPGPPARYAALYAELITRERWTAVAAEELARRHRLMLGGAIEALNDWAFERADRPLIEEMGGNLVIEPLKS